MLRSVVARQLPFARRFSSNAGDLNFKEIGFIGLGNMGKPMAMNLLKKGHQLVVFDLNKQAVGDLKDAGAKAAGSVAEMARNVNVLITMVPATQHVLGIYRGENGVFANLKHPGSLLVDCSTIDPVVSAELSIEATTTGHRMVDAPVSGGVPGATAGTLTFMVGGMDRDFQAIEPVLKKMGARMVHCGGPGKGSAVKVCNNLILAASMLGVSEGFRLAEKLGVDLKTFASVVNTSSGRCWSSDAYNPAPGVMENVPASRDYHGGFGVDLMAKDVGLALSAAQSTGASLPLTKEAHRLYKEVSAAGHGNLDFGCVYKYSK